MHNMVLSLHLLNVWAKNDARYQRRPKFVADVSLFEIK